MFSAGLAHCSRVCLDMAVQRRHVIRPPAVTRYFSGFSISQVYALYFYGATQEQYGTGLTGRETPGTILRGKEPPNYRHGQGTLQAKVKRTEGVARLQGLEALGRAIGLIVGPKTRGPKVKLV